MTHRQDPDHYEECPVNTGDGPAWNPRGCRCEAINAEDHAYYTEPSDMAAREWGNY